ncbi:restriction endonuclease [Paenibacillus hunanensis]|uniref:restriction endonuclease n=1 Tax=Paenibacillus hunanensis TaxID=539262 RepID=UPI002A6B019F|nr:restriction endonuclease [Paenibacillus hunanensis]WPP40944.1 restriction endonuclease [Paenibacillus hunanensis]
MGDFILAIIITLIILGVIVGVIYYVKTHKPKKLSPQDLKEYNLKDITINHIDQMQDGSEFEVYLYRLFLELGYDGVYKTQGSRDFGADVIFTDREGIRNVIQAKRYAVDNHVGLGAVQEAFSAMRYYKAKKSMVITSSKFTDPCETLAGINHVKLLDRSDLIAIIAALQQDDHTAIKNRIEAEPRMILETWSEMNDPVLRDIKKDYKAEKRVNELRKAK